MITYNAAIGPCDEWASIASRNCVLSDKLPTGVAPDCLCSRCLPSERAAARAALETISSDSDNQMAN